MQCKNHPTEKGVNTCNQCGSWLCERCSFERGGRIFCPGCATSQGANAETHHAAHRPGSKKYVSGGLLFLFSVVIMLPGLNYMYMGLIKRGLLAMTAFFGMIFLASSLSGALSGLFAFAIVALVIVCIFDGFNIRRRINYGEDVKDSVDDIIGFIQRNRIVLAGFLALLLVVQIIGNTMPWLVNAIPIVIAIWAVLTLFKKPKK